MQSVQSCLEDAFPFTGTHLARSACGWGNVDCLIHVRCRVLESQQGRGSVSRCEGQLRDGCEKYYVWQVGVFGHDGR